MVRIRNASIEVSGSYKAPANSGRMAKPALRIVKGRTCPDCRWVVRCCQDSICWAAEKAAIAAEKP